MSDNILVIMLSLALFFSVVYTVRDMLWSAVCKGLKQKLKGAVIEIKASGGCESTEALVRYAVSLDADEVLIAKDGLNDEGEKLVELILRDFPSVKIFDND